MLNVSPPQSGNHQQIISTLTQLRQEWQEATDGVSLLETSGNIGLLLADVINELHLNTEDQRQILGPELFRELANMFDQFSQN